MQDTDHIKLVLKHLDSEASPAEEAALQDWLDADPQHRLEYAALEKIWQDSGKVLNAHNFDVEAALFKVEQQLARHGQARADSAESAPILPFRELPAEVTVLSTTPVRTIGWKWPIAAAAAFLVICAAAWFFTRPKISEVRAEVASLKVSLPDGSVVQLRKGAILSWASSFTKERTVNLSGEAFFEPAGNASSPFSIRTANALFQDIGTSFLIKEESGSDELTVVSGKVKFAQRADPSNNIVLTPGQKALLTGSHFAVAGSADLNNIAWETGVLDFKDQTLSEVLTDITDYYQTPVVLSRDLPGSESAVRITARFDHQPLKEVLEEIHLMTGLSTRQEKGRFVFSH